MKTFLLLSLFLVGSFASPYFKGDPTELKVLVEFFNATGGPNWHVPWNTQTTDYCTWSGVKCNQTVSFSPFPFALIILS
jgi:hypothetical protein